MRNKIIFRADGNSTIGLGHLYRLIALAEMVKEKYNFNYLVNSFTDTQVIPNNYSCIIIPEEIGIEEEPLWLAKNYNPKEHIIIADGYKFDSTYQKVLKKSGYYLIYVDDFAREHMYADIVINHSIAVKESYFSAEPSTKFALGSDYAMLRPLFIEEAKIKKNIRSIKNVFICFGGSDIFDLTNKCLQGIKKISEIDEIHIVIGSSYNHTSLFEIKDINQDRLFIHKDLSEGELLVVMKKCQLAIVPTSTISYEVCSVKMAILGGYTVDNQINLYKGFQNNELIFDGKDFSKYDSSEFENQVLKILVKPKTDYKKQIDNQSKFFDGGQKERFLKLIKQI